MVNEPGTLGRVAVAIGAVGANITALEGFTVHGAVLHDDITIYTAEDFMMQLRILMIDHHKKMILKAINTPGRYEEKKAHIDKINFRVCVDRGPEIQIRQLLSGDGF